LLAGNDNKVGVCGEFWAKLFYLSRGYSLGEGLASNNEGHDFVCFIAGEPCRVSVKVVSDESKTGAQLPLKESENWDELLLVLLDEEMVPWKFGLVTRAQFNLAIEQKAIGKAPTVRRSWLGPKGWMERYGDSFNGDFNGLGRSKTVPKATQAYANVAN
jgi:hypothetical protein